MDKVVSSQWGSIPRSWIIVALGWRYFYLLLGRLYLSCLTVLATLSYVASTRRYHQIPGILEANQL